MRFLLVLFLMMTSAFAQTIYGIQEKTIDGKEWNSDSLKGKVALIVNIASQCGYTPQLEGLETLWQKHKAKDFILLGVPTNDFMSQTPEDDQAMKEFCSKKYNVTFPLLTKKTIKGEKKRPLYKFITEKTPRKFRNEIGWNFEKILINKKGEVVDRFGSSTKPDDSFMNKKIEALLAE